MNKRVKIVSTLGPAVEIRGGKKFGESGYWGESLDVEASAKNIAALIEEGANVFRFNFSHGDHPEQGARMATVHRAEEIAGHKVGFLLDTKGPEMRTELFADGADAISVVTGDKFRVATKQGLKSTPELIALNVAGGLDIFDDVEIGQTILIDDGKLGLSLTGKDAATREFEVEAQNDGVIGKQKGVNIPNTKIPFPALAERDDADIRFGLSQPGGINFIAISFVRTAVPFEMVPVYQKLIISKVNKAGKIVVTATNMLESMTYNPRATRSEISDVFNAVIDGTDATMLSGESANGKYPRESVRTMATVNKNAQTMLKEYGRLHPERYDKSTVTEVVAASVKNAAEAMDIKLIVALTESGNTARLISKHRPNADILAITFDEKVERGLMINWGVIPTMTEKPSSTDDMFEVAEKVALASGLVESGDNIIIVAGVPVGTGRTNTMRIRTVK